MAYKTNIQPPWKQCKIETCPNCGEKYVLGKTGTIYGCDRCEGITRDARGNIIIRKVEPQS